MQHDVLDGNLANIRRAQRAVNALIVLLRSDPRVQHAHDAWRDAVTSRRFQDAVDHAARLVRDDLGLSYTWLPTLLLQDFAHPLGIYLEPEYPPDLSPGKEKGGAKIIERDVAWFYRMRIKHPKDSERSIAREYLTTLTGQRAGDGRATVRAAVDRAQELLAVFELKEHPLPK